MKEYIVGRQGDQWFKIDNELYDTVHNQHVRITVRDDGTWWIEDLKGGASNGTFIREIGTEEWKPVVKQRITPTTMVRLSSFHSYVFMAHRVVQEPNNYTYELKVMLKLWRRLSQDVANEEARIEKRKKMMKATMAVGAVVGIGGGAILSTLTNVGLLSGGGIGGLTGLGSIFIYGRMFMAPDMSKLNELKIKRQKQVTCPKCGRPMSETDVNNMMCSICKCH